MYHYFFSFLFLLAPNVTVPVVLWADACPFASSSTAVPVHRGTECFMCTKILTLSLNGRGEQMGTLGKNGAWGDATCTCPRTCVSRPCSSLCMVARVLALQVWLSTCSMVSCREESSMCQLHFSSGWLPQYTWDGLNLNLFCSFTFIVNVTHKQHHQFTFLQTLVMANSSNFPNLTWYMHLYNLSAATNRTINH